VLRKDDDGTSMVSITKHPATHTKAKPKYVAPNLRGPKLVWVPPKSGWMSVDTIGIQGLIQLISYWSSLVESSIEAYCISYPNSMTS